MAFEQAIGAIGNIASSVYNNKVADDRAKQARLETYMFNEMGAREADKRTRALYWDLYSPQAQMQQLKEAGLSPSIYASGGMAGVSGHEGAQGGGGGDFMAPTYGIDPMSGAQMANIMAQTEKTKAETDKVKEDTKVSTATIANIIEDTAKKSAELGAIKAQSALTELQAVWQEYTNSITQATMVDNVKYQHYLANEMETNAERAVTALAEENLELEFNQETKEERKQQIHADLVKTINEGLKAKGETELNETEKNAIMKRLELQAEELNVQKRYNNNNWKYKQAELKQRGEMFNKQIGLDYKTNRTKFILEAIDNATPSISFNFLSPVPKK